MKDNLHLIARHVQCEIFDHNFKCRPNQLPVKLSKYLYKKCWPKCHSQAKKKKKMKTIPILAMTRQSNM